jgi:predicted small lipoprotein YifL
VNRNLSPTGWAVVLLGVIALSLGGCGRKGGLDLPPNASAPSAANASATAPLDTEAEAANKPSVFNSTYGTDVGPVAPKGTKKSFILDPLLGN